MTTRRRHRNSSNEQPISLENGALLHAADPLPTACGLNVGLSRSSWVPGRSSTPLVLFFAPASPAPAHRCLLERRHSEVKDDLSLCTSQSHSARSCDFVHMADLPDDSYQPHYMSPSPESSSPPRAVAL